MQLIAYFSLCYIFRVGLISIGPKVSPTQCVTYCYELISLHSDDVTDHHILPALRHEAALSQYMWLLVVQHVITLVPLLQHYVDNDAPEKSKITVNAAELFPWTLKYTKCAGQLNCATCFINSWGTQGVGLPWSGIYTFTCLLLTQGLMHNINTDSNNHNVCLLNQCQSMHAYVEYGCCSPVYLYLYICKSSSEKLTCSCHIYWLNWYTLHVNHLGRGGRYTWLQLYMKLETQRMGGSNTNMDQEISTLSSFYSISTKLWVTSLYLSLELLPEKT